METFENEFKMTHYIGVMLAQGGVLTIKEDSLIFSPGTLERTMGAEETVMPFDKIKMVEVTGTITESLIVRTQEKSHRFVGGEPYKIRDIINSAVQKFLQHKPAISTNSTKTLKQSPAPDTATTNIPVDAIPTPSQTKSGVTCPSCSKPIRDEFNFCPFCQTLLKKSCSKCFKAVEQEWKACAFCNSSL